MAYRGLHLQEGDGNRGWPEAAPFDRILAAPAGRMVIPVGASPLGQMLTLVEKDADGGLRQAPVLPVAFVPLTRDRS